MQSDPKTNETQPSDKEVIRVNKFLDGRIQTKSYTLGKT